MTKIKKAEWALRIALFGEYFGHGVFALMLKPRFVELITIPTGIGEPTAQWFLQLIGAMDITIALLALIYPFRLMLMWSAFWGFLTALVRPFAGDPIWDFVERWANWGVPLGLLYLKGMPKRLADYFRS